MSAVYITAPVNECNSYKGALKCGRWWRPNIDDGLRQPRHTRLRIYNISLQHRVIGLVRTSSQQALRCERLRSI